MRLPDGQPIELHLLAPDGWTARAEVPPPREGEEGAYEVPLAPAPVVTGRVVAAGEGEGIENALVWSRSDPGSVVRSGRDGAFRLPLVHLDDDLGLGAAAPGYLPTGTTAYDVEGLEGVVFRLEPAAHLAGRVVDGEGRGLAGATARAAPEGNPFSHRSRRGSGTARTESDGRFRVAGLGHGDVVEVHASREGFVPERARGIRIPAEEDVTLVLEPAATVSGRVVSPDGVPVEGARVAITIVESDGATFGRSMASDGAFHLGPLEVGAYDLRVESSGHEPSLGAVVITAGEVALPPVILDPE